MRWPQPPVTTAPLAPCAPSDDVVAAATDHDCALRTFTEPSAKSCKLRTCSQARSPPHQKASPQNRRSRTLCHPVSFLPQPSGAGNVHVRCSFWQSLPARPGAKARGPGESAMSGTRTLAVTGPVRQQKEKPGAEKQPKRRRDREMASYVHVAPRKRALCKTQSVKPQVMRSGAALSVHSRSPESLEHAHNSPSRGKFSDAPPNKRIARGRHAKPCATARFRGTSASRAAEANKEQASSSTPQSHEDRSLCAVDMRAAHNQHAACWQSHPAP